MRGIWKMVPTRVRASFERLPEIQKLQFSTCGWPARCLPLSRAVVSAHRASRIPSERAKMMDSVYPEPLSRLHRRAVRKKFHKNSARYRTQPVTFAEIKEVDEEQLNDDTQSTPSASKSELDLKAKFEEFKRQRDRDLYEMRLTSNGVDPEVKPENKTHEKMSNSKENENRGLLTSSSSILPYRGSLTCSRTSL